MFVTVLPIANSQYPCDPKLTETGQTLTVLIVLKRAIKILSGFGLSMNGQHVFCGDFIFSGHTMIFLLGYLVIIECKFFISQWPWQFIIAIANLGTINLQVNFT